MSLQRQDSEQSRESLGTSAMGVLRGPASKLSIFMVRPSVFDTPSEEENRSLNIERSGSVTPSAFRRLWSGVNMESNMDETFS